MIKSFLFVFFSFFLNVSLVLGYGQFSSSPLYNIENQEVDFQLESINALGFEVVFSEFIGFSDESINEVLKSRGLDFKDEWNRIVSNYISDEIKAEIFITKSLPYNFLAEIGGLRYRVKQKLKNAEHSFLKNLICSFAPSVNSCLDLDLKFSIPVDKLIQNQDQDARLQVKGVFLNESDNFELQNITPDSSSIIDAMSSVLDFYLSKDFLLKRLRRGEKTIFEAPLLNVALFEQEDSFSSCTVSANDNSFSSFEVQPINCSDSMRLVILGESGERAKYQIGENGVIHQILSSGEDEYNFDFTNEFISTLRLLDVIFAKLRIKNYSLIYREVEKRFYVISQINEISKKPVYPRDSFQLGSPFSDVIDVFKYSHTSVSKFLESYLIRETLRGDYFYQKNRIRRKISQKWLSNASKRIFSDPLRSFLEIVVNAHDASVEKRSVGKFGIGFFSILSFLSHEETSGTKIEVDSCYRNYGGTLYAYRITFSKDSFGAPAVSFKELDISDFNGQTGTYIKILPNSKYFSDKTLSVIEKYLHYLDFYKGVRLQLDWKENNKVWSQTIGDANSIEIARVWCKLFPEMLSVRDRGSGIPLNVAFSKLLVPSSTNKQVHKSFSEHELYQQAEPSRLVHFKGKSDKNNSHFLITVNGVVVVDKVLFSPIIDSANKVNDILIEMPQQARLTLARDEVWIDPNTKSFEEKYIEEIIQRTLETVLFNEQSSPILLNALYNGLKAWEEQSAMSHIRNKFTYYFRDRLDDLIEKNDHLLVVPENHFHSIKNIVNKNGLFQLLPMDSDLVNYNFSRFENFLVDFFKTNVSKEYDENVVKMMQEGLGGNIIAGKNVFFVDDKLMPKTKYNNVSKLSSFGLRTSLFVPRSFLIKKLELLSDEYDLDRVLTSLMMKISNSLPGQTLVPNKNFVYDWKFSISNIQKTDNSTYILENPLFSREDSKILFDFVKDYKVSSRAYYGSKELDFDDDRKLAVVENEKELFEKICDGVKTVMMTLYNCWNYNEECYDRGINRLFIEFLYLPDRVFYKKSSDELFFILQSMSYLFYGNLDYEKTELFNDNLSMLINEFKAKHPNVVNDLEGFLECEDPEGQLKDDKLVNMVEKIAKVLLIISRKMPIHEYMNLVFAKLMNNYLVDGKSIFFEGDKIWPVDKPWTKEKIEKLFWAFTHYDYKNGSFDPRKNLSYDKRERSKTLLFENNLPDIEEFLKPLNDRFKDYLSMAFMVEKDLKYGIPEIKFGPFASDLFLYYHLNQLTLGALGDDEAALLEKFHDKALGLYSKYFNISDRHFQRIYGRDTQKAKAIYSEYDVSDINNVYHLLVSLQDKPAIFRKLRNLQIADFEFKMGVNTEVNLRDNDLKNRIFYIPSLFANTPFSVLTTLFERGVDVDIISTIIEHVRSEDELMLISHVLLDEKLLGMSCNFDKSKKEDFIDKLTVIITRFMRERIDSFQILKLYRESRLQKSLTKRLEMIQKSVSARLLVEYFNQIDLSSSIFTERKALTSLPIKNGINRSFSLRQLLKAHIDGSGLESILSANDLDKLITVVRSYDNKIDLNKIGQCIESGSEKNSIEGVLSETLQNSLDAIKSFFKGQEAGDDKLKASWQARKASLNDSAVKKQASSITYKLQFVNDDKRKEHSHMCLTIRDYIGFSNLETLLTDFILPDYSLKSPSFGHVGDMGNGSFKMYQDAEKVLLLTRLVADPSRAYLMVITPIRLNGLVEDLEITCFDVSNIIEKDFWGTSVRILFKSQKSTYTKMDLLYAEVLLRSAIGVTQVDLPMNSNVALFINDEMINEPQTSSSSIIYEKIDDKTGEYIFRLRRQKNDLFRSYVATGGVLFSPLDRFLRDTMLFPFELIENVGNGLILDVSPNYYTPVQSRSKLNIKPEYKTMLKQFLLDCYYINVLEAGKTNLFVFENNFIHFGSRYGDDLHQTKLSTPGNVKFQDKIQHFLRNHDGQISFDNARDFFTYFKPSWSEKTSFFDLVDEGRNYYSYLENFKGTLQKQFENDAYSLIDATIKYLKQEANESLRDERIEQFNVDKQKLYIHYQSKLFTKIVEQFNAWKEETMQKCDDYGLVENVVVGWFRQKVFNMELDKSKVSIPKDKKQILKTTEEKNHEEMLNNLLHKNFDEYFIDDISNLLVEMSSQYCFILQGKIEKDVAWILEKVAFTYAPKAKFAGLWLGDGILLNAVQGRDLSIINFITVLMHLIDCENSNPFEMEEVIELFIPKKGHTPTIVHELEHARRAISDEVHTDLENPYGEKVEFDVCANDYANVAIEENLLEEWRDKVFHKLSTLGSYKQTFINLKIDSDMSSLDVANKSFANYADKINDLLNWIEDNIKTEKDYSWLMDKLSFSPE